MLVLAFKKVDLKYWYDLVLQQVSRKRKPDFQQRTEYNFYIFDPLNLSALATYLISTVSIYDFNFTKSSSNFRKNNGNRNCKNTFK